MEVEWHSSQEVWLHPYPCFGPMAFRTGGNKCCFESPREQHFLVMSSIGQELNDHTVACAPDH
jgi:hypothetical protein